MPWGVAATIGVALISANAAKKASGTQQAGADAGIAQQDKQFEAIQKLMKPFVDAGYFGLEGQQGVLGQMQNWGSTGLDQVMDNPLTKGLMQQSENAVLANASATGGLRGGNVQGALANTRLNLLSGLENQQYGRLSDLFNRYGSLTQTGQAAAAGQAGIGAQTGFANAGLMQQGAAAQAGGQLAQGNIMGRGLGQIGGLLAAQNWNQGSTGYTPDNSAFGQQDFSAYGGGVNNYQGYY